MARSSNYPNEEMTETEDFESDISTAPSVFSLATLPSTTMTTDTRLTMDEMQTAIEELVSIFFDDWKMAILYMQAIVEKQVSLDRLVRNLRRLIKGFAMNLKDEACEAIDFDLAKLITTRARLIADKFGNKLELELRYVNEPTALTDTRPYVGLTTKNELSIPEDIQDLSSDEDEEQPETFSALVSHGRSLILESDAFNNLRKELEKFVNPSLNPSDPAVATDFGGRLIDIAATRAKFQAKGMEKYPLLNKIQRFCRGEDDIPEKHKRFRWTNARVFPCTAARVWR